MNDKLVTLIGGGGFLGRYVAQALMAKGARVRVAQRDPRQAFFLKPLGGLGQTQFVALDILRPETVARAVQGSDAVVNLVGVLAGDFDAYHVRGAANVAKAVADAGIDAFVHVSAIGADPASSSRYGKSKGEGETAVRATCPGATIVRPSIVFGQEDAFINRFAAMIAKAPVVPVLRPTAKFQPVFVGDVADGIVAALADPQTFGGKTLELVGPDVMTMADIFHWIAGAIGRSPSFVDLPDVAGSVISRLPGGPITPDQWQMLQTDNVASVGAQGLAALGVPPTPLDAVAPAWLVRFQRAGRFGRRVATRHAA